MKYGYLIALAFLPGLLNSCKKDARQNCAELQRVRISVEKDSFYVGDEIRLKINHQPTSAYFKWIHAGDPNTISDNTSVYIGYANKDDEGWYYLAVNYPGCNGHYDSVYISVSNKPATAPCSTANNAVSFSAIPDINPATVTWSLDNTWNRRILSAKGAYGYPDFNIYFNTYWSVKEPEDGEYTIATMQATGEYPVYNVYVSSLYSGIWFQGSGKVYVSHVNGKLRVTFCSVSLTGDNGGMTFKTTASGTLTAP